MPITILELRPPYSVSKKPNNDTIIVTRQGQSYYFSWKSGFLL